MLREGVLSIAIRADFWQPQKKRNKSRIDQILALACCPRQNEHRDIKRVAYNHVTTILQRCQKGQKCVVFLLLLRHFLLPRDFSGTIADIDIINTPLETLRPAYVPFGGFVDIAAHFLGEIPPQKKQFWGRE